MFRPTDGLGGVCGYEAQMRLMRHHYPSCESLVNALARDAPVFGAATARSN
jgi:hypothetical protein